MQILAAKLLLTSKEIVRTDLLVRQNARQNRQFIAEMFLFFSEFFGWRDLNDRRKYSNRVLFVRKLGPYENRATYCNDENASSIADKSGDYSRTITCLGWSRGPRASLTLPRIPVSPPQDLKLLRYKEHTKARNDTKILIVSKNFIPITKSS